jgi:CheY-like chemotaxis protein
MSDAPNGRVLVVDDERDSAVSLGMLLRAKNYEARWCFNAIDCFDIISSWCPDAVLLDLAMPGITGYEIASTIRSRPESRSLALIALTGYGRQDDILHSRDAGFNSHLLKPVAWDDLDVVLKSTIGARGK